MEVLVHEHTEIHLLIRGVRQRKGVTAGAIAPQQPQLRSREGDPTRTESLDWTSGDDSVQALWRGRP